MCSGSSPLPDPGKFPASVHVSTSLWVAGDAHLAAAVAADISVSS